MPPRARKTAAAKPAEETAPVVDPEQTQTVSDSEPTLPEPEPVPPAADPEPDPEPPQDPEPKADEPSEPPVGVDRSGWAREQQVALKLPHGARGQYATKLLDAATYLGYPTDAVRSQSDGFQVPLEIHRYLFPSEYADSTDDE